MKKENKREVGSSINNAIIERVLADLLKSPRIPYVVRIEGQEFTREGSINKQMLDILKTNHSIHDTKRATGKGFSHIHILKNNCNTSHPPYFAVFQIK